MEPHEFWQKIETARSFDAAQRRRQKTTESGPPPLLPAHGGRGHMRVFRACPAPDSRLSAARRGQIPGLLEIQIPLLSGKKNPTRPSVAKDRLENVR
jgi:hypothetical protein